LDFGRLSALLAGGGIDCVVFISPSTVHDFARLVDAGDLGRILEGVTVACADQSTSQTAAGFGLRVDVTEIRSQVLAEAFARERG
jgi:uroporphyrinogen-III synthase